MAHDLDAARKYLKRLSREDEVNPETVAKALEKMGAALGREKYGDRAAELVRGMEQSSKSKKSDDSSNDKGKAKKAKSKEGSDSEKGNSIIKTLRKQGYDGPTVHLLDGRVGVLVKKTKTKATIKFALRGKPRSMSMDEFKKKGSNLVQVPSSDD